MSGNEIDASISLTLIGAEVRAGRLFAKFTSATLLNATGKVVQNVFEQEIPMGSLFPDKAPVSIYTN